MSTREDAPEGNEATPFERLRRFLVNEMSLSHVYQPVMLRTLLRGGGTASRRQIAQEILARDPTQVEYYEQIVRDMVGHVLTVNRGITARDRDTYTLPDFGYLLPDEVGHLVAICDERIAAYELKRDDLWEHRRRGHRPISGTVRYEVLKRAKYHCELCGVSADVKALEVDHVIPRNHGGHDDLANYQALCFTCNASKRDRDRTDFRGTANIFAARDDSCLFCTIAWDRIVAEDQFVYAIRDAFPVTPMHTLIIPKRHVADYFGLLQPELNAMNRMLTHVKSALCKDDPTITGFNIGMNCGRDAGQTVFHSHTHLIPRREGDVENPRGGVRHLIPGKGFY